MKAYSIGRDVGCDIVINDPTDVISRRHATLTVADNGKMTITDLSRNGTYVNGIRISQNAAVPVTRKDNISFAHVAKFDWNLIPNTSSTVLRYALFGLIAAAVIVALCFILPPLFSGGSTTNPEPTATAVDSAQLKKDQDDKAAALKADIKKQVEDSLAREKAKQDSIAKAKKQKNTPKKPNPKDGDAKNKDDSKNKDDKKAPEEPTFR